VLSDPVESGECRNKTVGSGVSSQPECFTVQRIVRVTENLFLTVIDNTSLRNSVCEAVHDGEISEVCNICRKASDTRVLVFVILDEIPEQCNVS
jgi:hypothetical protein